MPPADGRGLRAVYIHGSGKVGTGLARALRKAGVRVTLRSARRGLPRRIDADVVVLAVRDGDLASLAHAMASKGVVPRKAVALHVAGALGAEVLAPLRAVCAGVAQMHPLVAFASKDGAPPLAGCHVHVAGDGAAVRRAKTLAKVLRMVPRTFPRLDTVGYHAAAGLVANGAAALAALGADLLTRSGVPAETAPALLAPLLGSVASNVKSLGFPGSLTGPVRRGDAAAVASHLAVLEARLPAAVPLYREAARAQLPLARALGEAPPAAFDSVGARLVPRGSRG